MNGRKQRKEKRAEKPKAHVQRKEPSVNSKLKGRTLRLEEQRERVRTSTGKEQQKGSGA